MTNITIQGLNDDLRQRLQKRANRHGRSLEEEAREILRTALTKNTDSPLDMASAIADRFADLGGVELPEIPRDPIREPPNFEDDDYT